MAYDFIRSAREDTNGVDRTGASCSTVDDSSASDKSFIANVVAATGDVILLRPAVVPLSFVMSPRRIDDRDLADITCS